MKTEDRCPEYVIRVKLPSAAGYHSSPSGDTEYEIAYDKAIHDALPPGFEVASLKTNERYAVDSEGRSMVLIRPKRGQENALVWYMEEHGRLRDVILKIRQQIPTGF